MIKNPNVYSREAKVIVKNLTIENKHNFQKLKMVNEIIYHLKPLTFIKLWKIKRMSSKYILYHILCFNNTFEFSNVETIYLRFQKELKKIMSLQLV